MKRITPIFIFIFAFIAFFGGVTSVSAQEANEGALTVDFNPNPLFNASDLLPGDLREASFTATNNTGASQPLFIFFNRTAKNPGVDGVLLSKRIDVTVTRAGGGLMEEKTLFEWFQTDPLLIGSVSGGANATYNLDAYFDIQAGNKYQPSSVTFAVCVGLASGPVQCSKPGDGGGNDGGGGDDVGTGGGSDGGGTGGSLDPVDGDDGDGGDGVGGDGSNNEGNGEGTGGGNGGGGNPDNIDLNNASDGDVAGARFFPESLGSDLRGNQGGGIGDAFGSDETPTAFVGFVNNDVNDGEIAGTTSGDASVVSQGQNIDEDGAKNAAPALTALPFASGDLLHCLWIFFIVLVVIAFATLLFDLIRGARRLSECPRRVNRLVFIDTLFAIAFLIAILVPYSCIVLPLFIITIVLSLYFFYLHKHLTI